MRKIAFLIPALLLAACSQPAPPAEPRRMHRRR